MTDYILTTDRLRLRHWKDSDIEPFAAMNMDKEVMRFFPKTLSYSETLDFIDRIKLHFRNMILDCLQLRKNLRKNLLDLPDSPSLLLILILHHV